MNFFVMAGRRASMSSKKKGGVQEGPLVKMLERQRFVRACSGIRKDFMKSKFFGHAVDEATAKTKKQHLIQYISYWRRGRVLRKFWGIVPITAQDAKTIYEADHSGMLDDDLLQRPIVGSEGGGGEISSCCGCTIQGFQEEGAKRRRTPGSFAYRRHGHPLLESLESCNDSKKKFLHHLLLIQRWAVGADHHQACQ